MFLGVKSQLFRFSFEKLFETLILRSYNPNLKKICICIFIFIMNFFLNLNFNIFCLIF